MKKILLILICAVLIVLASITSSLYYQKNLSEENELYKIILRADRSWREVSIKSQKAELHYNEVGYAYEDQNFKSVESNCRLARDYYLETSQDYKGIKAELIAFEQKDNLIDIYIVCLDLIIESTNNMYEACEYFESASRYYDKYYYSDVIYDDMSYNMGTAELENHNEKIRERDISIEKYNQCLENFKVELNKRIE